MKTSKGGMTAEFILGMDVQDYVDAIEAAEELEKRIADAMR